MARLLFPLDGTASSFDAIAAGLRTLGDAHTVTLLTVMQDFDHAPDDRVALFAEDEDDQIMPTQEACERVLAEGTERCAAFGIRPEVRIRRGRVVPEILAESDDHDILVMHALAKTRMRDRVRFAHGGQLARRAGCHVLLVHTDILETPAPA